MSYEEMARANYWVVVLNHRNEYVAYYLQEEDPSYILDADNERGAWEELCHLEGISTRDEP